MTPTSQTGAQSPFSARVVLGMVLIGASLFIALLWMIGSGEMTGDTNDGQAHVGSKGLNGYAALADYLEKRGHALRRSRSEAMLDDSGLLVLTPTAFEDGEKLNQMVEARRYIGPTMVITPKWQAAPLPQGTPKAGKGWVTLAGTQLPQWQGFLDDVSVLVEPLGKHGKATWQDAGGSGPLADGAAVLSGKGDRLVPLVIESTSGRVLAAYVDDDGVYSEFEGMELSPPSRRGEDKDRFPLVVVFEPDLLNNFGMAHQANAALADRLFSTLHYDDDEPIIFDLTLNGFARSANLLTLAFTPPYLAATLCLILAALVIGWRAFLRFGAARQAARAIAFGKRALVSNAAGLIRRAGRLHLVTSPYATAVRERLERALALPRMPDVAASEAAIDRALAAREPGAEPFSAISARLRAARRPQDMLGAARALHAIERTLKR